TGPSTSGPGPRQPARNSTATSAESSTMPAYSASRNNANRRPVYSVYGPTTSSESASGMSNGGPLSSPNPPVTKTRPPRARPAQPLPPPGMCHADQRQGAGRHGHAAGGQHQRHLVGEQLRGRAHRAEQGVLVGAGPAGHQRAQHPDGAGREHEQQPAVQVGG